MKKMKKIYSVVIVGGVLLFSIIPNAISSTIINCPQASGTFKQYQKIESGGLEWQFWNVSYSSQKVNTSTDQSYGAIQPQSFTSGTIECDGFAGGAYSFYYLTSMNCVKTGQLSFSCS